MGVLDKILVGMSAKDTGAAAAPGVTCDPEIEAKAIQILACFSDIATQDEVVMLMESAMGSKMEGTDEEKLSALSGPVQKLIGKSKEDIKAFLTGPETAEVLDKILVGMSAKDTGAAAAPGVTCDPEIEAKAIQILACFSDIATQDEVVMLMESAMGSKMEGTD